MNNLTKLKATGNSLGAETHETPLGNWAREDWEVESRPGAWAGQELKRSRFCYFQLCDLQLVTHPL